MNIGNRNTGRENFFMGKRLRIAVFIVFFIGIVLTAFRYFKFVSKTVYEESASHLTEVFHQSNNVLNELANKNLTYLHMWGEYLQKTSDESEIRDYIDKAQEEAGFLYFYFLSADGNYKMLTGEAGYLGLQENLEDKITLGEDIITNAVVPGKQQMLVFASPQSHGSYQGFEYDAIAIAYENADIVDVLDISAFNGNAKSYVVHPDGRVVIDHSFEAWGTVYNFFGVLREHSNISEKEILELSEKFKERRTDTMLVNLDGSNYYLVYGSSECQDWIFLGLVQADIVNASMNSLQLRTMLLGGTIVFGFAVFIIELILQKNRISLKRRDVEILYRDELFQKLSMSVDDVFLMLDAKTYKADYVSPNVEKLLGITVEQIQKDISVLGKLHSEDCEDPKKNYLKEIQVNEQQEWDFEYVHQKTGEQRWFHIIAMGSEVNGKKKYILVMSDRTVDKKMNQALYEAVRAAETANRAKSTFLSNMSHDIRTPMNVILGYNQLMKTQLTEPKQLDYQKKIEQSRKLLLSIINNVLDMARIESGKMKVDENYERVGEVVDEIISTFASEAEEKGIHLSGNMQVTHRNVLCDGTKIREIREHNTTTGKVGGTGLGMPIVKKMVDLMGGSIEVESELGKGTVFTVTLMHKMADKKYYSQKIETVIASDMGENLRGKHILLAEDNELNAEIAIAILEETGLIIDRVEDGIQCVNRIDQMPAGTYDMILMDIQMPNMDGYKATKCIRHLQDIKKAEIPIIAMTANAFEEDRKKAFDADMNEHIAKPIDIEKLRAVILSVLNKQEN